MSEREKHLLRDCEDREFLDTFIAVVQQRNRAKLARAFWCGLALAFGALHILRIIGLIQ